MGRVGVVSLGAHTPHLICHQCWLLRAAIWMSQSCRGTQPWPRGTNGLGQQRAMAQSLLHGGWVYSQTPHLVSPWLSPAFRYWQYLLCLDLTKPRTALKAQNAHSKSRGESLNSLCSACKGTFWTKARGPQLSGFFGPWSHNLMAKNLEPSKSMVSPLFSSCISVWKIWLKRVFRSFLCLSWRWFILSRVV